MGPPHTWQGLEEGQQIWKRAGMADWCLSPDLFVDTPSCLLVPSLEALVHHKLDQILPLFKKECVILLPGSEGHGLEQCLRCRKTWPCLQPAQGPWANLSSSQGSRVPKGARTGLATPVVLKVWAAPLGGLQNPCGDPQDQLCLGRC